MPDKSDLSLEESDSHAVSTFTPTTAESPRSSSDEVVNPLDYIAITPSLGNVDAEGLEDSFLTSPPTEALETSLSDYEYHALAMNEVEESSLSTSLQQSEPSTSSSQSADSDNSGGDSSPNDDSHSSHGSPPDSDDPSSESASSESEDSDDGFNLNPPGLYDILQFSDNCSKKEAMAMVLSHAMRHNIDYIGLINYFTVLNVMLGRRYFPCTKRKLWRDLKKKSTGMSSKELCKDNQILHHLESKKQFQSFLDTPGSAQLLEYRETRRKVSEHGVEDILYGSAYKELREEGQCLESNHNFSYSFNTDGAKMSINGVNSLHFVFVRFNEVEPRIGQKLIFLAAVYVGDKEPDFHVLLKWFVRECNDLSTTGLLWKPDGLNEIRSTFHPTVCVTDAKARCCVLNQSQHNGHYSCTFCNHVGISILGGPCKFPLPGEVRIGREQRPFVVPECEPRTEETTRQHLIEANATGEAVQGMKPGLGPVFNLQGFRLGEYCSPDDLHPIYEGVTKFHTTLLVTHCNLNEVRQSIVTNRMKAVKFPRNISREKMDFSQRAKWKGSQWRTWLLYLSISCLQNIQGFDERHIRHLSLLSHAIYLLSRDVIHEDDLNLAEEYLLRYVVLFQEYFGEENMRFHVHMLLHMVEATRRWGPLWAYSTEGFESWNGKVKKKIKSPSCALDQVVDRHILTALVGRFPYDLILSERVKNQLEAMWRNEKVHQITHLVDNVYLLGRGDVRNTTEEERNILLNNHGYDLEELSEYKSVSMRNRMMCHALAMDDNNCDNSTIYTYNDMFCDIKNIVLLNVRGREEVGMFVNILETGDSLGTAHHIVQMDDGESVAGYISISLVRCVAIKVTVGNVTYISPPANHMQID
ncbi:hypothetical protein ONE63_011575 [Megalurothrips usitatus]|uniref:Uncharacterized protein n=1 Tax=Megalurothrips usitatus TaxID=439358 RepID=A0AAV7WYY8_9NEOP|nr:hypothetical protein ONE63_011575 [Megalurothrips usitatus]